MPGSVWVRRSVLVRYFSFAISNDVGRKKAHRHWMGASFLVFEFQYASSSTARIGVMLWEPGTTSAGPQTPTNILTKKKCRSCSHTKLSLAPGAEWGNAFAVGLDLRLATGEYFRIERDSFARNC